jgi:hypothetical protein
VLQAILTEWVGREWWPPRPGWCDWMCGAAGNIASNTDSASSRKLVHTIGLVNAFAVWSERSARFCSTGPDDGKSEKPKNGQRIVHDARWITSDLNEPDVTSLKTTRQCDSSHMHATCSLYGRVVKVARRLASLRTSETESKLNSPHIQLKPWSHCPIRLNSTQLASSVELNWIGRVITLPD